MSESRPPAPVASHAPPPPPPPPPAESHVPPPAARYAQPSETSKNVIVDGFTFSVKYKGKNNTTWRCRKNGNTCKCSLKTSNIWRLFLFQENITTTGPMMTTARLWSSAHLFFRLPSSKWLLVVNHNTMSPDLVLKA